MLTGDANTLAGQSCLISHANGGIQCKALFQFGKSTLGFTNDDIWFISKIQKALWAVTHLEQDWTSLLWSVKWSGRCRSSPCNEKAGTLQMLLIGLEVSQESLSRTSTKKSRSCEQCVNLSDCCYSDEYVGYAEETRCCQTKSSRRTEFVPCSSESTYKYDSVDSASYFSAKEDRQLHRQLACSTRALVVTNALRAVALSWDWYICWACKRGIFWLHNKFQLIDFASDVMRTSQLSVVLSAFEWPACHFHLPCSTLNNPPQLLEQPIQVSLRSFEAVFGPSSCRGTEN